MPARLTFRWIPAFLLALSLSSLASAQTVRIEAESFLAPTAMSTIGTGVNATQVVTTGPDPTRPSGYIVGFFTWWEWLEYEFNVPEDGTYTITVSASTAWGLDGYIHTLFSFYTSGQQVYSTHDIPQVTDWLTYTTVTLPQTVALKAGTNRMRVSMRPDSYYAISHGVAMGGGMNPDYFELTKVGAYPAMSTVSGNVTATVGGAPAPLEGALISVGTDYNSSSIVTRTDATGAYTLMVPTGSQDITAFANGYGKNTVTVTGSGTQNFSMTYNGRFEAELLDATNDGYNNIDGLQPEYTTEPKANSQPRSNFGQLIDMIDQPQGKWASYKHIVVPTAGVYDLTMNYTSDLINDTLGYGRYLVTVNDAKNTKELRYGVTGDKLTYLDCDPIFVNLNQGTNTVKIYQPDNYTYANIDYLTIVPTTRNPGTLKVVVTGTTGTPIVGANVKVTSTNSGDTGITGGDGSMSFLESAGTYDIVVSKSGASQTTTGTVTDGSTTTVTVQLAITATLVEAEDFVASGPNSPTVQAKDEPSASGGKYLSGFSGQERPEWVEWILNASESGMYTVSIAYASVLDTGIHTLNVWNTCFKMEVPDGLPTTSSTTDFQMYTYQASIPLKAGENRLRLSFNTANPGAFNLDYLIFEKAAAYPTVKSCSGTVKGQDGTYTGAIQNADVWVGTSDPNVFYLSRTPASGAWSLTVPSSVGLVVNVTAEGYTSPASKVVFANGTYDAVLPFNNPNSLDPPVMQVMAIKATTAIAEGLWIMLGDPYVVTMASPGTWFDMVISVPRTGMYKVGMRYASGWFASGQPDTLPVRTIWTVNGSPISVDFAKTTSWIDYQYVDNIATIPLHAGANTIHWAYVEASSNVNYLTFVRTGDIPSADIDGNGRIEISDAVMYSRRLKGVDTGATPDLNSDSASNSLDVAYIMRIAGGLQ